MPAMIRHHVNGGPAGHPARGPDVTNGRPPRRSHRTVLSVVLVVLLLAACSLSLSLAPAPATPGGPPFSTIEAGNCTNLGACTHLDVARWTGIRFTPPVPCSAPSTTVLDPGTQSVPCQLVMNVFAPTSGGPWPLLVISPGGPAQLADQLYLDDFGALLAGQGAVVMESQWRQLGFVGSGYPTAFADVACAIGIARRTGATFGSTSDRVTLVGHSLGGWAASIVLLTPTAFSPAAGACDPTAGSLRPDAVAIVDGAMNEPTTTLPGETDYVADFLGGSQATLPAAWAAVDPYALATRYPASAGAIPAVLIEGSVDNVVPPSVAQSFQSALASAGYRSRLVNVPAADHISVLSSRDTIDAIMRIANGN